MKMANKPLWSQAQMEIVMLKKELYAYVPDREQERQRSW